ncbi:MAG: hypothetical protein GWM87_07905, partial [Xanthomonadales bacterium]|nr:hypothetical protein [Xanthomonadales bacterium]NIX12865.1 hypothetical protein [Xanthomonadales bacterium]
EEMLAQVTEQDGRSCVRVDDIDGYAPLDDTMVSVSARGRKHYLMTTMFRCNSLRGTFRVGVSGRFSEVCGGGMGHLVTDEETCP